MKRLTFDQVREVAEATILDRVTREEFLESLQLHEPLQVEGNIIAAVEYGRRLEDLYAARTILSNAVDAALHQLVDAGAAPVLGTKGTLSIFQAAEVYRLVANAREHVYRAIRKESGLDERGDPCLPSLELCGECGAPNGCDCGRYERGC